MDNVSALIGALACFGIMAPAIGYVLGQQRKKLLALRESYRELLESSLASVALDNNLKTGRDRVEASTHIDTTRDAARNPEGYTQRHVAHLIENIALCMVEKGHIRIQAHRPPAPDASGVMLTATCDVLTSAHLGRRTLATVQEYGNHGIPERITTEEITGLRLDRTYHPTSYAGLVDEPAQPFDLTILEDTFPAHE